MTGTATQMTTGSKEPAETAGTSWQYLISKPKQGMSFWTAQKSSRILQKAKWIERAYGRYINDSDWLIMPYQLNDPGVMLNYEGEKEVEGQVYDVVKITFEGVGLTPDDTYWAYIGKSDRLMHKWEYLLQGQEADAKPSGSWWKEWQTFGNIKLAMNKEFEGRPVRIYFKDLIVSTEADKEIFQLTSKTF